MRWLSASPLLLLCCSVFALSVYFFHKQLGGSIWQDALEQIPDSLVALQQCPSPYYTPINTKAAARPDLAGLKCVQLNLDKSTSGALSAQICETRSTATCNAFEVVIKRKKCDELDAMRLSSSAREEQYIREELGSDTFHIAITGPELYATVTPTKYSQCEYRYEIRLSTPGDWKIQLWHIYEAYDGLAEIYEEPDVKYPFSLGKPYSGEFNDGRIPRWPRNLNIPLLSGGFNGPSSTALHLPPSIICPAECPQYAFPPSDSFTRTRNKDLSPRTLQPSTPYQLPLCLDTGIIPGVYLPDPTPLHQVEKAPITKYKWQPVGCRLRKDVSLLLSNPDEMDESEQEKRRECLIRKKTFLMQGDSHLRMIYDALVTRIIGKEEAPIYYKSKRKDHTIEQVRLIFLWDPFLESIGSEEADYILVSAGAHQASEHFLTDAFLSAMRRFVAEMQVWQQKSGVKLLYLTSPARPPRGLPNGFSGRDWRTNPRMQSWGKQTIEMLKGSGLRAAVIEGYETSLPFYKYTVDEAHFMSTPVMEGWLEQIVHQLNLCGSE